MKNLPKISVFLTIVAGILLVGGGLWGIAFTYKNVARENITTSGDASIPNTPVRGPFTLRAQAEVIRMHTLNATGGLTYAEMPRQIPKLDANGNPVRDADGEPVMVANELRNMWITATTLTTALNFAVMSYAFSALSVLFGLISIWTGLTFHALGKRH